MVPAPLFPDDALTEVVQAYCAPLGPYHVSVTLRRREQLWQRHWDAPGGQPLDHLAHHERAFALGDLSVSVRAVWGRVPLDGPAHLHTLASLLRRELGLLLEQARLRTAHDQLSAMLQATPLALYAVTLEGLVRHWNSAAETTLGLSSQGVLDQPLLDSELGTAFAALRHSVSRGEPLGKRRVRRVRQDGTVRAVELSAAPYGPAGHPLGLVGIAQELSPEGERLAQAEQQRTLLESVLAFANDSVLITEAEPVDAPGPRILYANEAFTRTTGYSLQDVLGQTPRLLQGPRSDRKALAKLKAALLAWQPVEVELINYRKDGSEFWVELSIAPVADATGWYTHWISIQRDITDRKLSAIHLERERTEVLELAARNMPLDEVLARLIGSLERAFAQYQVAVVLAERPPVVFSAARGQAAWERPSALETLLRAADYTPVALGSSEQAAGWWACGCAIRGGGERRLGVISLLSPHPLALTPEDQARLEAAAQLAGLVIDRYDAQRNLERQATHDALTGLPNRVHFGQALTRSLAAAQDQSTAVAVGLMDLDRFKLINDTLGHSAGDLLLQKVAVRLRENMRPDDRLARMGGDEFLLAFEGITHPSQVEQLAERLLTALEQPFTLLEQEVFVRPSVGFSLYPEAALTPELLLQQADAAMYRAKRRGGGFALYHPELERGPSAITLESALNRALERGEFVLHYQPQFALASGRVVGLEALLRWQHPELGLVPPSEFIPLAEVTGLIVPIGRWVMEQAARQAVRWSALHPDLVVGVNLSARQFEQPGLIEEVRRVLRVSGLPAGQLELELTESMLMQAVEATETLRQLKALGVRLALDDFGTGYSNLAYLKHFPLDVLKIDQSFIQGLGAHPLSDRRDEALMGAVIHLAQALDLTVTVEGVEREAQLAFLRQQTCNQVQGFLLARPQAAQAITAWLGAGARWPQQLTDGLPVTS